MDGDQKDLSAQLMFELSVINLNFQEICDYFGIPKKQRYNPNCGKWIVKWIKSAEHVRQDKRPDQMFGTSATPESIISDPERTSNQ
jgi:hypothetical protein